MLTKARSRSSIREVTRVESKMILDERRDEEIAVVVAVLPAQDKRHAGAGARFLQQLRLELVLEKRVLRPLIDQWGRTCPSARLDQRRGVVFAPAILVLTEVSAQRLLAPRAAHRR